MSTTTLTVENRRSVALVKAGDYLELTKPRIAVMVLVTVAISAFAGSWGALEPWLLLNTLLGTALVAASASALNQYLERHTDRLMPRTADRPLPSGRLSTAEVLGFGFLTAALGFAYLAATVNLLTGLAGVLTWVMYVAIYTPLKARTPANTLVGAVAGAMPVVIGWTAVARDPLALDADGVKAATLFLIVFLWQFPHFMAIAWIYRHQYAAAGLKMLPVVDPSGDRAGTQAILTALALIPVSLIPLSLRLAGPVYFGAAMTLGLAYVYVSVMFSLRRDEASARTLLKTSLVYLPALLGLFLLFPRI